MMMVSINYLDIFYCVCVWNLSSRTKTTKEQKTNQVDEHTHCLPVSIAKWIA